MIETQQSIDPYLARFDRFEAESRGPSWLLPIRKAAIARFAELGFPTTRDEEWRFTNVAPIADGEFEPDRSTAHRVSEATMKAVRFSELSCRLLFINGRFLRDEGRGSLPSGVKVLGLAEALRGGADFLEAHLARHARYQDASFTALNTALMEDGAVVVVPRGVVVEQPIHLIFASQSRVASHPRVLIVAEPTSQVEVVETHIGQGEGAYFTNPVSEIVAGDDAVVRHYKLVRDSYDAFHVGTTHLYQRRGSHIASYTLTLGGALVRNDVVSVLDGEGAEATMDGLYVIAGRQHVDNHLRVEHLQPHCNSREFFNGVLDESARGVFTGRIFVEKDAQKTDAKQTNRSLLLSRDAQVDSKPQLEIFADDVKCTHGATIGQVDPEALFYLRTRGIHLETARAMLVYAFARESLQHVRLESLRRQLESLILDRLPNSDFLREEV